ncbi:MAG: DUF411 domain-containing protein [Gammaproteobacteria bacterium]|jgi:hypothetical protein|nr:DUF411 domain-containing protein [Gammaproteobacteria bacterium]MBT7307801.1 DUF411 domain-containing protein [Gammaproteobacteria bacterium]
MSKKSKVPYNRALKRVVGAVAGVSLLVGGAVISNKSVEAADLVVYKSPSCGCCGAWVEHLKESGLSVEVNNRQDMNQVKSELGIPQHLRSCHTAKAGKYVIEGHVPADLIAKMLKEKPAIKGLTVPGMPMGSPGMEGPRSDPYDILAIQKSGGTQIYASRNQ